MLRNWSSIRFVLVRINIEFQRFLLRCNHSKLLCFYYQIRHCDLVITKIENITMSWPIENRFLFSDKQCIIKNIQKIRSDYRNIIDFLSANYFHFNAIFGLVNMLIPNYNWHAVLKIRSKSTWRNFCVQRVYEFSLNSWRFVCFFRFSLFSMKSAYSR